MSAQNASAVTWHLNEALSMLYELHVDQHGDGGGTPAGRGECEACDIWREGVAALRRELTAEPPVILIEAGTEPEGLPVPVITKDQRITSVSIDWSTEMSAELVERAIRALTPLRDDHERFAITLDRLELRRQRAGAST